MPNHNKEVGTALDRIVWQRDRALLDDLVFRLEWEKQVELDTRWELGDDCFSLYKVKWIVDNYARFWASRPDFRPQNVFEIGIWDGGSLALWYEQFLPRKLVGIDIGLHQINGEIVERSHDSEYYKRYLERRGLHERIKTFWKVDQADRERVRQIVAREFDGPIDLVIDDGSHFYQYTKAAFETLFPVLRAGGLYIIEDWAWAHWGGYEIPGHAWENEPPLSRLIKELVEVSGSPEPFLRGSGSLTTLRTLIRNITITPDFAVFERGDVPADELKSFALEKYVIRRPQDDPRRIERNVEELHTQHEDLKAKYLQVEASHQCEQEWRRQLEVNCAELQKNYAELETIHNDLYKYYRDLEAGTLQLQKAYDESQSGYQDLRKYCDDLEAGNREYQKACTELEATHRELYETSQGLEQRYQAQGEVYEGLQTTHQELGARHRELEASHLELQTKYGELETNLEELRINHQALLAEQQELRALHANLSGCHRQLMTNYQELGSSHYHLEQRHIPLTYFSGLFRATLRAGWGKIKRTLSWSRS